MNSKTETWLFLDLWNNMSSAVSLTQRQFWRQNYSTFPKLSSNRIWSNRGAEVQVEDEVSVKNAKFYPKGISFTANNLALVYLLDVAGAKTSSDIFHDLHGTNVVDTLFLQQCEALQSSVSNSCEQLDRVRYWRNHVSCWIVLPGNFNFFSLIITDSKRYNLI